MVNDTLFSKQRLLGNDTTFKNTKVFGGHITFLYNDWNKTFYITWIINLQEKNFGYNYFLIHEHDSYSYWFF